MLNEAMKAGENRDYQRATELLLTLVSESDSYPQAYLYLGRSLHALKRFPRAIQYLHYFVELEPSEGAGFFFLGRSYLAGGMYSEAVTYLERAESLDRGNSQILGHLGLGLLKCKRLADACVTLGRAVEVDPANSQLYAGYLSTLTAEAVRRYRRGDVSLSLQMLEFLRDHGISNTLTHLHLGACYRELGRYDEALREYDWAIEHEPRDPVLKLQRSEIVRLGNGSASKESDESNDPDAIQRLMAIESFDQGKYRKAREYAKSVIKSNGPDYEMHLLIGDAFRNTGHYQRAINHFQRAAKFDRSRTEPRYGIVLAAWMSGSYRRVAAECRAILRIDPGDDVANYYSALAMGRLDYPPKEAAQALERELKRSGSDAYLCTSLGNQYLDLHDEKRAEQFFRMAIDISESHRDAYEGLFRLLESSGSETAADAYATYLRHYPDDTERRRNYVRLLVSNSRYEAAVEEIQTLLPTDGETEGLRRLFAYCLRETRKFREAAVVYRRLLKEHPESDLYLRALSFSLEKSGNIGRAIELLKLGFEYKRPSAPTRSILGGLLCRAERYEEALGVFREVLEEAPDEWRALMSIGSIYRVRGMDEMADRYADRAVRLKTP